MELVGEGGGWSSGVGTKVRLEVGLNSRGEVLSLTDSKLLIRGIQGITERTSLNSLFSVSWMVLMLSSCIWGCSDSISGDPRCESPWTEARISRCEWFQKLTSSLRCCGVGALVDVGRVLLKLYFQFPPSIAAFTCSNFCKPVYI